MKKNIAFLIVVISIFSIITTVIINITGVNKFNKSEKIEVIATLFPQYDFVKQVGGDKVNVTLLLPPGTESHTYEPTPQDMMRINNSDLFVYTGIEMEPWADNLISGVKDDINVLDLSTTVELINSEEFEEVYVKSNNSENNNVKNDGSQGNHIENNNLEEGDMKNNSQKNNHSKNDAVKSHNLENHGEDHHHEYDPHIWLNPQYAIQMVRSIEQQLSRIDVQNSTYYKNNANNYIEQIQQLDSNFEEVVNNSTKGKIAFGGAFAYAYFIERYNLEFISAYETCGESSEPSTTQIKNVIDYINQNKLPVIFYKEYTNGNMAKTISDETGAKMLVFNTVHNVSKQEIEGGATYVSIMQENLENLKQAL